MICTYYPTLSTGFSVHGGPGINPPWIPRNDCIYLLYLLLKGLVGSGQGWKRKWGLRLMTHSQGEVSELSHRILISLARNSHTFLIRILNQSLILKMKSLRPTKME